MNVKSFVSSLILFSAMVTYADPIKGEGRDELASRAKKSQVTKAPMSAEEKEAEKKAASESLKLLSKSIKKREYGVTHKIGYLEFDTDGNTNTVEVTATQNVPCCTVEENIQAAQVGDTKTADQWKKALTHADADRCMGLPSFTPEIERERHEIQWKRLYRSRERK